MKSTALFLLVISALASAVHLPTTTNNNNGNAAVAAGVLVNRAMDPATMDPTHLSILSVLETAMPTGPNMVMPTGTFEPVWYQDLSEDVKALLPKFYPVVEAAGLGDGEGSSEASTTVGDGSKSSAETEMGTVVSDSPSASLPTTLISPALTPTSSSPSSSSSLFSSTTTTTTNSSPASLPPQTTTNSASPLPSASSSPTFSAGAKASVHMGWLAAVAWLSLAAMFCVFA